MPLTSTSTGSRTATENIAHHRATTMRTTTTTAQNFVWKLFSSFSYQCFTFRMQSRSTCSAEQHFGAHAHRKWNETNTSKKYNSQKQQQPNTSKEADEIFEMKFLSILHGKFVSSGRRQQNFPWLQREMAKELKFYFDRCCCGSAALLAPLLLLVLFRFILSLPRCAVQLLCAFIIYSRDQETTHDAL